MPEFYPAGEDPAIAGALRLPAAKLAVSKSEGNIDRFMTKLILCACLAKCARQHRGHESDRERGI